LEELAKHTIIHRDIKIANIFIGKNGVPKIADFGFAVKATDKFKDLNIGSPLYMSPEGLLSNMYGPKTDVWSLGVLLYELING
jgi:p21-activated kinase 1